MKKILLIALLVSLNSNAETEAEAREILRAREVVKENVIRDSFHHQIGILTEKLERRQASWLHAARTLVTDEAAYLDAKSQFGWSDENATRTYDEWRATFYELHTVYEQYKKTGLNE